MKKRTIILQKLETSADDENEAQIVEVHRFEFESRVLPDIIVHAEQTFYLEDVTPACGIYELTSSYFTPDETKTNIP